MTLVLARLLYLLDIILINSWLNLKINQINMDIQTLRNT